MVARDREIPEAFREVRVVISNKEAGADFIGTKGTEVAEGTTVTGGADGCTAINLGPDLGRVLREELGIGRDGTEHVVTAGETEGTTFGVGEIEGSLVIRRDGGRSEVFDGKARRALIKLGQNVAV